MTLRSKAVQSDDTFHVKDEGGSSWAILNIALALEASPMPWRIMLSLSQLVEAGVPPTFEIALAHVPDPESRAFLIDPSTIRQILTPDEAVATVQHARGVVCNWSVAWFGPETKTLHVAIRTPVELQFDFFLFKAGTGKSAAVPRRRVRGES
jgi:hypothetical protein